MVNKTLRLEHFFLITSLFPFVSPYPIGADVQPLAGIFALFVLLKLYGFRKISMKKKHFFILFITFTLLFYIDSTKENIDFRFGKAFSLFFGSLVFVAFYHSKHYLTSKFFSNIVRIYFIFSVLTILFPSIFIGLQGYIVRAVNVQDISGVRGISTFCTEPGLFGGVLIAFFIINDYFFLKKSISKYNFRINFVMLFIMIIATKSGTGYMLFFFYILIRLLQEIKISFKHILLFFVFILLLILIINNIDPNVSRGLQIFVKLISNPVLLFNTDLSILTRVVSLYVGILSIFHYPFGVGINDISSDIWFVIENNDFLNSFPKYMNHNHTDKITLVSSFGSLTVMYGLIWWFLFGFIIFIISKSPWIAKVFATIFMMFSFSSAFPLIWILLGLDKKRKKIENKR